MMDDLISRQALKERLMYMARFRTNSEIGEPRCGITRRTMFHMSEIMKTVIDLPTIEERKTGKWEEIEVIPEAYDIAGVKTWASKMRCNQCGFTTFAIEGKFAQYDYCPNCGADMRGDEDR